ncbi:hypothetical protein BDZ97DRAFT_1792981 [Flammula alnicola]|nr:hypothetical protein BDZ97DRAFT_1792981 [Flammula alnicola]
MSILAALVCFEPFIPCRNIQSIVLNKRHTADLEICPSKSELRSTRTAIPLPEFISSKSSIYDPGWLPARIAAYVVGKPLWWALEQMGIVGEEGLLSSGSGRGHHHKDTGWWGEYVLVPLVERAADQVVERQDEKMASAGDALYTMDSAGGSEEPLRETDAKVLVKYLERDRGVLVVDKEIIKFVDKNAPAEERMITAVDRGILELKNAIWNLRVQVESLQSKMDDYTRKASAALQQKRKPAALSYLRSRKQLEDLLNKRLGSLTTLESTFITVEAAAGDVEEVDDAVRLGGDIALGIEDTEEWKAMVREAQAADRAKELEDSTRKSWMR